MSVIRDLVGAAALAGMQLGWVSARDWGARTAPGRRFEPRMSAETRDRLMAGWQRALAQTLTA